VSAPLLRVAARLAGQRPLVVTGRPGSRLWLAVRPALPLSLSATAVAVLLWAVALHALAP